MDTSKPIPADIVEVYSLIKMLRYDLSDLMAQEADEWRSDLSESVRSWRNDGGKEPDWDGFRESMNEICSDDGMPYLFEEASHES